MAAVSFESTAVELPPPGACRDREMTLTRGRRIANCGRNPLLFAPLGGSKMFGKLNTLVCLLFALAACTGTDGSLYAQHVEFTVITVGQFDEPWALEFLPDGRLLISEVDGRCIYRRFVFRITGAGRV